MVGGIIETSAHRQRRSGQDVAVAVGRCRCVLGLTHDANGQGASLDLHVRDVDEPIALDRVLDVLAGQPTLEVEHDTLVGAEEEHGDLVPVAVLDVTGDAVTDDVHDAVGIDLDEGTEEQVHDPLGLAQLGPLHPEELDGSAVEREVASGQLAGCHLNALFSHTACQVLPRDFGRLNLY